MVKQLIIGAFCLCLVLPVAAQGNAESAYWFGELWADLTGLVQDMIAQLAQVADESPSEPDSDPPSAELGPYMIPNG